MVSKKENIEKKTPWTNLQIKIDLDICLTRKVLSEKHNLEKSRIIEMTDFFMEKFNNCELFEHKDYSNWIFYIKNNGTKNEILFEKDEKNKLFYIKHAGIWEVFETRFGMQYADIQTFTQDILEELLKFQGYKTETVT
jgi:hypothetical protein